MADLRAAHMNTLLGNLWHVVNPLLLIGVYFVIFGVLLQTDRGVDNYIAYLAIGVFSFRFTQNSIQQGAGSIVGNSGLIRSMYFPRAILPIAEVVEQVLLLVPSVAVVLLIAILSGQPPLWTWLLLPFIFAVQTLFNLGGAFIAARVSDAFHDFRNVLPYFFRILFYGSAVLFSVDRFVTDPALLKVFYANPIYAYITLARYAILSEPLPWQVVVSALIWAVVLLVVGLLYFRAGEPRYGRG
jgi:teichoic acid transport system permease protein